MSLPIQVLFSGTRSLLKEGENIHLFKYYTDRYLHSISLILLVLVGENNIGASKNVLKFSVNN